MIFHKQIFKYIMSFPLHFLIDTIRFRKWLTHFAIAKNLNLAHTVLSQFSLWRPQIPVICQSLVVERKYIVHYHQHYSFLHNFAFLLCRCLLFLFLTETVTASRNISSYIENLCFIYCFNVFIYSISEGHSWFYLLASYSLSLSLE